VYSSIDPDAPLLVVPDVKLNLPLAPVVPAFNVDTINAPLDVGRPYPVSMLIDPPEPPTEYVDSPPFTTTSPPVNVVPAPTDKMTSPPFPFVAVPVYTTDIPEEPELVVPVKNSNDPLVPFVPVFTDWISIAALVDEYPFPVDS
jgi:hypothetical protein